MNAEERGAGVLLGLALGDALGAPHEGGPLERALWALLSLPHGRVLRWTDDTQMAVAAAESLIAAGGVDTDDLARRWAADARYLRGYGPGTWKWIRRVRSGEDWRSAARSVFPDGSFGNGGAMRAAPFGVFYHERPDSLASMTAEATAVTHAHPLGVEGGVLLASATAAAMRGDFAPREFLLGLKERVRRDEFRSRLDWAAAAFSAPRTPREVRRALGNGVAAHESAVTALYAFARHHDDFEAMMSLVISIGGDADTIGAMAGAVFGARNGAGALPADRLERLEERERIERLGRELAKRAAAAS
ncbi:MAG: ADP-ribosylglycohydrolase family protein [Elusimicrobia bacterium]|nr:ADP-ribosylglycohydrolase family protein [Elusimicrobiota bacterium]